jgi:hypothetical protein
MRRSVRALGLAVAVAVLTTEGSAQAVAEDQDAAAAVVRELYDHFKIEAGNLPDWDAVRSAFLPEAVIVLRTARDVTTVFTVDGFIQDWLRFIEAANVEARGFSETIVKSHTSWMGTMASMMVLYEARFSDSDRRQRGVDIFLLTERPEGWKIAAVTNEIPNGNRPIPAVLEP